MSAVVGQVCDRLCKLFSDYLGDTKAGEKGVSPTKR